MQLIDIATARKLPQRKIVVGTKVQLRPFDDLTQDIAQRYYDAAIIDWTSTMLEQHEREPRKHGQVITIFEDYDSDGEMYTFAEVRWPDDCWSYFIDDLVPIEE